MNNMKMQKKLDSYAYSYLTYYNVTEKSQISKILNSEENLNKKSLIKWQNKTIKHIKRMDNNSQITDLVQAFSDVENDGLNLALLR